MGHALRPAQHRFALEPRQMFDAAAAADMFQAANAPAAGADAPREASAGEAPLLPAAPSLETAAAPARASEGRAVYVIDAAVRDASVLEGAIPDGATVLHLAPGVSGMDQLATAVASLGDIGALHLISHGAQGQFTLGGDTLDAATLEAFQSQWTAVAAVLRPGADILLYGCRIAADGGLLVEQLARMTGADVAASIDATGAAARGGDWVLEAGAGEVTATVLSVAGYGWMLAAPDLTAPAGIVAVGENTGGTVGGGITVGGTGADVLQATASVTSGKGTLAFAPLPGGVTIVSGSGTASIVFRGTAADLQTALSALQYSYVGTSEIGDSDALALSVTNQTTGGTATLAGGRAITVQPQNDVPSVVPPAFPAGANLLTLDEGGGVNFVAATPASGLGANQVNLGLVDADNTTRQVIIKITALPSLGTLTLNGREVAVGQTLAVSDIANLRYVHGGGQVLAVTQDSFRINVDDGAGGLVAGVDVPIRLNPVNDRPAAGGTITLIEGETGVPLSGGSVPAPVGGSRGSLTITDPDQAPGVPFTVDITSLPVRGVLRYDGALVSAGQTIANFDASRLAYSHDGSETTSDSFTIRVTDDGGGAGGASRLTSPDQTISLSIIPNNDDPTLPVNTGVVLGNGQALAGPAVTLTRAMLQAADVDSPDDRLTYTLTGLPTNGYLVSTDFPGTFLPVGFTFKQSELDAGKIRFIATSTGPFVTDFDFTLTDSSVRLWPTPQREGGLYANETTTTLEQRSFRIESTGLPVGGGGAAQPGTAAPVNAVPVVGGTLRLGPDRIAEGQTIVLTAAELGATDADNVASELVYRINALPQNGQLLLNGTTSLILAGSFTQADVDAGRISYRHDGGEMFDGSFQFTLSDGERVVGPRTFAFDVLPQNDTPTASGASLKVAEGGSIATSLGVGDGDNATPTDRTTGFAQDNTLTLEVVTLPDPLTGQLRLDGTPVAVGDLLATADLARVTYHHLGAERYTDSFQVRPLDDRGVVAADPLAGNPTNQPSLGGTITVNITVLPVNDPPVFAGKREGVLREGELITIQGATGYTGDLTGVTGSGTPSHPATGAFLSYRDSDNATDQRQYRVTTAPANGAVRLNGQVLGAGSVFTQADLDAGRITYVHDGSETTADFFDYVVSDGDWRANETTSFAQGTATTPGRFNFAISGTNDAPAIAGPSGPINIDSTVAANNPVAGFVVSDIDLTAGIGPAEVDFVQVTLRLLDSSGAPITNYTTGFAGGGVSIAIATPADTSGRWAATRTGANDIVQFQGSRAQVNAALAGLTVTFANDCDLVYRLQVIVDDRLRSAAGALDTSGSDANGGELNQGKPAGSAATAVPGTVFDWATAVTVPVDDPNITARTVDLHASHTNDPATFTAPAAATVDEDVRTRVAGAFTVSDPESAAFGTPVVVTLSVPASRGGTLDIGAAGASTSLTPSGGQAVTITGDNTRQIVLTGRAADIQALLNGRNFANTADDAAGGLFYTTALNVNHDLNDVVAGDVTVSGTFSDSTSGIGGDVGAGSVANNPADVATAVTITAVNDAPSVAMAGAALVVSGTTPITLTGVAASDVDADDGYAAGETDGTVQVLVRLLGPVGTPLVAAAYASAGAGLGIVLDTSAVGHGAAVDATLNGSGAPVAVRGTLAQVNAWLAGLQVTFANLGNSNVDQTYSIEVIADDRLRNGGGTLAGGANGGATNQQSLLPTVPLTDTFNAYSSTVSTYNIYNVVRATRSVFVSSINDPGSISANNVVVAEASATLVLGAGNAGITIADPDDNGATNLTATVTLPDGSGLVFSAVGGSGGSVAGTNTRELTLTGTEAQLNSRLQALTVAFPDPVGAARPVDWNGGFTVTVVYNDAGNTGTRPASIAGDTDAPTVNPGDFAYADGTSAALVTTRTFTVTVTPVNDAPVRLTASITLPAVDEDSPGGAGATPPGDTVSTLFGSAFSDAFDQIDRAVTGGSVANAFAGIAIAGNAAIGAQGAWQYSSDGSNWTALPVVSQTSALQLQPGDRLRFVPAADFHGTPGALTVRLVDASGPALVTGSTVNVSGALSGGITRYSDDSNAVTLTTTVSPINDRPTAASTALAATFEDNTNPTGAALSSLGFGYSDAVDNRTGITGGGNTATSLGGYAIVGNAASAASEGRWQFNTGGAWTDVGAVSDASAVVLPTTASLRFLPAADYNGTPGALTLRLADSAQAAATGVNLSGSVGQTGTWSLPVALATSVDPRNDAPVLAGTVNATFTEGSAPVALLSGGAASDIDLPGSVTFGGGRITVTLDTWRAGDVLSLAGSPAGVTGTTGGNGTSLVVNLNTAATPATVGAILNALRFENPTPHLLGVDDFDRVYTVVLNDGNNVNGAANAGGNGGGDPTLNSNVLTGLITLVQINDPGSISANNVTVAEASATLLLNAGNANIAIADPDDNGATNLTATVTLPPGSGLVFSAVGGSGGSVLGTGTAQLTLTGTEAQLNTRLQALTVAFPDPAGDALAEDWNGSFTVTVVYNDAGNTGTRPASIAGDTNNPTANPGDFAYADGTSAALVTTRTFTVTVTPVNDAPLRLTASISLPAVDEDSPGGAGATPPGDTVSTLFGSAYTDARDQVNQTVTGGSVANAFAGIAIAGNAAIGAQGAWQYSSDGSNWTALPVVSETSALQLQTGDRLRFVPAADFHGTPGALTVRLVDASGAALVTGSTADVSGALSGGITRYSDSSNAVTLNTTVSPINDRPTAASTGLAATFEDNTNPTGATLSSLAFAYGDAIDNQTGITGGGNTATSLGGYAIVGNAASAASEGRWQFNTGGAWTDVGVVSDASAVVLPTTASLRFLPAADYNGTPGALTLRLADSAQAAATGVNLSGSVGQTGTWSLPVALATSVDPRNDAPVLAGTVNATFTEGSAPVALLSGGAASDIDLPGSVTFGGGRITVTLDTWRAGDVLSLAGSLAGVTGTTGGNGTSLVVNLNTAATPATVGTILNALRFENTSNDPVSHLLGIDDFSRAYTIVLNDGNNVNGAANAGGNGGGDPTLDSNVLAGVITLVPVNDPPVATDDQTTLTESTASVSGNVKTGIGGTLDTDPDHRNDELSVDDIRTGAVESAGTAGTVGGTALAGLYGTLAIAANGAYTYTLDTADPLVNALSSGESLLERFNYRITDPDGGRDTALIRIEITGVDDGPPSITAVDGNGAAIGQATVFESGLTPDGPAGESRIATGTLSVSAPSGLASVTIGGTSFTVAQLAGFTAGSPSAIIDTGEGQLRVTGLTVTAGAATAPTAATLSYEYTLKAAIAHTGASASESTDGIALIVTDRTTAAAAATGTLTVRIVDDTPTARADTASVTTGTPAGRETRGQAVTVLGAGDVADRLGADTVAAPVTGVAAAGVSGTPGVSLAGTYGRLELAASGAYTYRADVSNQAVALLGPGSTLVDVFDYTVTDADGDTSTTTITITLRGEAQPQPPTSQPRGGEGERHDLFRFVDLRRPERPAMEPSLHVQNAVRETAAGRLEHGRLIQGLALPPGSEIESDSLSIPDSMDPAEHVTRDGVRFSRQLLADGQERPGSLGNVHVIGNQGLFDPFPLFGLREVVTAAPEEAARAARDEPPPVADRASQPEEGRGAPAVAQDGTSASRAMSPAPWTGFTQQLRQVALERALVREGQSPSTLPRVVHAPAAVATEGARTLARAG